MSSKAKNVNQGETAHKTDKQKHEGHDRTKTHGHDNNPNRVKKGGAGGHNWGDETIQDGPAVLDKGDPNYVDEEDD
eukprot:CAMPEP_0168591912 /NCGR_PEP_ID=MMETSP0420-20121227/7404_1 /TAXON_ID=498008 /ORGANISM="Pessonella sp." /LENGTH=75 /DNA_ID=CAMNT_0008627769 /DNA_START=115 /DNA_END=342 /DNA_ORIENTATION=-